MYKKAYLLLMFLLIVFSLNVSCSNAPKQFKYKKEIEFIISECYLEKYEVVSWKEAKDTEELVILSPEEPATYDDCKDLFANDSWMPPLDNSKPIYVYYNIERLLPRKKDLSKINNKFFYVLLSVDLLFDKDFKKNVYYEYCPDHILFVAQESPIWQLKYDKSTYVDDIKKDELDSFVLERTIYDFSYDDYCISYKMTIHYKLNKNICCEQNYVKEKYNEKNLEYFR